MKTKLKVLFISSFLVLQGVLIQAQVTIGSGKTPENFSVLELVTTDTKGGLRLPQLDTEGRNNLSLSTLSDQNQKNSARGLAIFNTETKCFEFWNSMEWISLCTGQELGLVNFSNCDLIKVVGVYDMDSPLNDQDVRIDIPVNVKKLGTYKYSAVCNGVTFSAIGTFVNLGPTTVSLYVDISGSAPTATGTFQATVTITPVAGDPDPTTVVCNNVSIKFVKRSSATLKILNISGDENNTGLTSSGGNYTANSVYARIGTWLAGGSQTMGSITVPQNSIYYSGTQSITIVDVPYSSMATLQNNLEDASIVWAGASEKYSNGFAQLIREWNKAGKGIVITTGDKIAESTISDALGYYIEDGSAAYGLTLCSVLPQVFSSAAPYEAPFNLVGVDDGIDIGRSGANCGYVLSNNGVVFMKVASNPSAFADIDNGVFIFGDKFGAIDVIAYNSTYWNNYAKVLVDIFAWSLKNAPIY